MKRRHVRLLVPVQNSHTNKTDGIPIAKDETIAAPAVAIAFSVPDSSPSSA